MVDRKHSLIPLQLGESLDEVQRPSSAPTVPNDAPTRFPFEDRRPIFSQPAKDAAIGQFDEEQNNSSLSNLESFLGSGLVESMDHATKEQHDDVRTGPADLSYHRMARHSRNRKNNPFEETTIGLFNDRTGIMYASRPSTEQPSFANAFPSAVTTPPRTHQQQPRSTTPVELYPGQHSQDFPCSIDIGTNVVEPEDESQLDMISQAESERERTVGSDSNGSLKELARGVKNMWSPEAREFKPASGPPSQASSLSEPGTDITPRQAEAELSAFLWDGNESNASRTLAILRVSWLRVPDIRAECERFGSLESFRVDFLCRGIVFASYYDIRSAQYASKELQPLLQRLSVMHGSSDEVMVLFCLPLNSSSQFDEGRIHLAHLPAGIDEQMVSSWLSSYGSLRSVARLSDNTSYMVEYHNIQDAKQALLELETSQPWGDQVFVEVCMRDNFERRKGRELLSMISRWRQMLGSHGPAAGAMPGHARGQTAPGWGQRPPESAYQGHRQYAIGPDGRYTEVTNMFGNNGINHHSNSVRYDPTNQHHQTLHGPVTNYNVPNSQNAVGSQWAAQASRPNGSQMRHGGVQRGNSTYGDQRHYPDHFHSSYSPVRISSDATSASGRSYHSQHSSRSGYSIATTEERDNRQLALDLEAVEEGVDTRTSLMVRNIPNKYTQKMLLSEFEENGHGPGVIDFFYLPIDFKNRCNRGYAFINFVDYKDILNFHRRYYGKHWRTFNSDKICDITYARIQGKEAMLKRFQNSALMDKDEEYKPLVFTSHGPQKGRRLPFPTGAKFQEDRSRVEV